MGRECLTHEDMEFKASLSYTASNKMEEKQEEKEKKKEEDEK